jgi:hypothetical protein
MTKRERLAAKMSGFRERQAARVAKRDANKAWHREYTSYHRRDLPIPEELYKIGSHESRR